MNMMTGFAIAASLGAVVALVAGIVAMTRNCEIAHMRSEQWMGWRVVWQALALLFISLGIASTAAAQAPQSPQGTCAFDYPLLTENECQAYRSTFVNAGSRDKRQAVLDEMWGRTEARAKERGVAVNDWRGYFPPTAQGATR